MRVTHFNSYLQGGAATAARRLHESLVSDGFDSHFYCSPKEPGQEELNSTYQPSHWKRGGVLHAIDTAIRFRRYRESFKRGVRDRAAGHEIFTSPRGGPDTPWPPVGHPANDGNGNDDLLHLHWIAKFIDQRSFFASLPVQKPVVWTLHDMNAFTGGCHFSGGCNRYLDGCGNCPQLKNSGPNDLSSQSFSEKQSAIENLNLHVAAPSRWLIDSAKSSLMFRGVRSFHHIPYGIDTDTFVPMDKTDARRRLGLAPDATVVCFGAMDVNSIRKGGREMTEAFAKVADVPGVIGLVFGGGELPASTESMPPIHSVGSIHGTLQQRSVFSAADVFVLPSLEDNLPLTGLEAMACGIPIVGFDAGGIPDYVRPNVSGSLAETGNSDDLAQKLRALITDRSACQRLGHGAREMMKQEYDSRHEVAAYRNLYEALSDTKFADRPMAA